MSEKAAWWLERIAADGSALAVPVHALPFGIGRDEDNGLVLAVSGVSRRHGSLALDPATGRTLVEVRSSAKVLAVGPTGMIIGEQREIGFVAFGGTTQPASPGSVPAPADTSLCDGPKDPLCGQGK